MTTTYRVTIEFDDDFADHDHPSQWDWASLIDQPGTRVIAVEQGPIQARMRAKKYFDESLGKT